MENEEVAPVILTNCGILISSGFQRFIAVELDQRKSNND